MRLFKLISIWVASWVAGTAPLDAATGDPGQRPNVVLISIDDLNDWVGALDGHPQARTPNIDALAERGTLFTNAHAQAPVCTPSRTAILTGRRPSSTGAYFVLPLLHQVDRLKGVRTLFERFETQGYRTWGAGKIYHGREAPYFEEYGGSFDGFGPFPKEKLNHPPFGRAQDWGPFPERDEAMSDWKVADFAVEKLEREHEDPFFLGVGFFRPHVPMYAPEEWFERHPIEDVRTPRVSEGDLEDVPEFARLLSRNPPEPVHDWILRYGEWQSATQAYLACTTFVDAMVGRVLDALRKGPHADNTIVVLFGDHGWHLGEKRHWGKRSLWEESTRVPLIFAGPGIADRTRSEPVELMGLYPTLLEMAGLPEDEGQQAFSLVPLLRGSDEDWSHAALTTYGRGNHALRTERWRYIRYADGSRELYDMRKDPRQIHNLADDPAHVGTVEELDARLDKRLPDEEAPVIRDVKGSGLRHYLDALEKTGATSR